MDSRQVLARFGAERQALALMDHPNIAKVFDAGTTDAGRPYFVMELVKGIPITKFCDERRLTLRERLELAIPVCQAVQHAHQKGIIHRDLKPSNVLIALYDGKPVPKVIDFGVAKATGPRLTDQTLYTEFGAVVGTLEYMSPEQAELNQLDIDTRSDIYSLGVLLYELLTGSTPLERKRLKAGGVPRGAARDPRGGVAAAEHAALDDRGAALDRGLPARRAAEAERAGARRARLDRDEGAGEGPQPAIRDGQRPGGRPAAVPGRRAGAGVPAVDAVPAEEIRAAEQASPCCAGRCSPWRSWSRWVGLLGESAGRYAIAPTAGPRLFNRWRRFSTRLIGWSRSRSGPKRWTGAAGQCGAGRRRGRASVPGPRPSDRRLTSRWSPVSRRFGCRAASYQSSPAGDWQRERPLATRKLSAIMALTWGRCRLRRQPPACVPEGPSPPRSRRRWITGGRRQGTPKASYEGGC